MSLLHHRNVTTLQGGLRYSCSGLGDNSLRGSQRTLGGVFARTPRSRFDAQRLKGKDTIFCKENRQFPLPDAGKTLLECRCLVKFKGRMDIK
jgi:hypothetical protein